MQKFPRLVSSTRHYNCVIWGETYYGIPKFLGDLDLHKIHLADYSMIICEPSLKALKRSLKGPIFPHLRLRNSNIVKPETTSSGAPSSLSKMDLLKKIYQMKRSPFWGFTRRAACLDAGLPLEAMPTEQLCQQCEHLDRTTRGKHMRRYGLGLVDSVRSLSMRSLNIQASPRGYKVISMHPTLVESLASYHLFYFRGAFYGVPVAFGDVNLTHFEEYDAGSILFDSDLASLKRRITEGEGVYAQPTLLESLKFYYIVAWGQDFYAVPTIYSNLKKSVNSEVIAEILNANHKTIFHDISVLNLRKRVRNCESIYQIYIPEKV